MVKVLFVGNSFTYYNDLPDMITELSAERGIEIRTGSVTKGGWYLKQYADPEDEMRPQLLEVYGQEKWDYIVLQDQSLHPAVDPEAFIVSVKQLQKIMKAEKSFLLYQTWAYEDGSEKLKATGMDYVVMRDSLKKAYEKAAQSIGCPCIPVGSGFSYCHDHYPWIDLYQSDGFHPSLAGSYLAACMIIHELVSIDPERISAPDGLREEIAVCLRRVAEKFV